MTPSARTTRSSVGPLLEGPSWRVGAPAPSEDRCSLARLLFGLGQAQMTGVIRVLAPFEAGCEEKHELYLRLGRVVHVRPPSLDEPLGHVLVEMGFLDHEGYARSLMRMAEERARHGTVLKRMGLVSDQQLAGALAVQILRRSARMFALRGGRYAIDPYDHEHGRQEDGEIAARGVGVRRVIYNGVLAGYSEVDLVWELNLLAGRRVRLRRQEARRLGRYGFGPEARRTLDLLAAGFCEITHLLALADSENRGSTALLKALYTLLVTELLEVDSVPAFESRDPTAPFLRPPRLEAMPVAVTPVPPFESPAPQAELPVAEPGRVVTASGAKPETLELLRRAALRAGLRAVESAPDPRELEGKARFLRGEAYLRKGDSEMALNNLKAAASLLPADPDVKAMLALAVWRSPDLDAQTRGQRARQLLGEALARAPMCARAYRVFGEIYAGEDFPEQAIRCYAKVLQLLPGDVEAARELKRLERRRTGRSLLGLFRRK